MRFCAVSCCQRSVAACSILVWPDFTTSVPSSMYFFSVSIAPSKKKCALLSSSEPANSSMLNGPFAPCLRAVLVQDAEAGEQRGGLRDADLVVVEADVEVDVLRSRIRRS